MCREIQNVMNSVMLVLQKNTELSIIEDELTDQKILKSIQNFDISSLNYDILKKISVRTKSDLFKPEIIKKTNVHASYFCEWVK
jgi:hypothetical protein